jgi:DNA-binding PadR family transcriptional regulator
VIEMERFGRFAELARLIITVLGDGPRSVGGLLDAVRSNDGPIGPGSLYAALARLERRGVIEPTRNDDGRVAYRLRQNEVPG